MKSRANVQDGMRDNRTSVTWRRIMSITIIASIATHLERYSKYNRYSKYSKYSNALGEV